jgi:S-(hydroxymethyl)glutathione dehydrogenase/alcohol dehydrogenase
MKVHAAILWEPKTNWSIESVDVDGPKDREILVRWQAAGICHSDEHHRQGEIHPRFPHIGGHEGVGIVEEIGREVTKVAAGDTVVGCFIPACGRCRWCSTGKQNLCDAGAKMLDGCLSDGTYRFHCQGQDIGGSGALGTFAEVGVISEDSCVVLKEDIPPELACLLGCCVPTGWGSAVYAGDVSPGETVVVYGSGGVGMNAVQGAAYAGASSVVVIEPVEFKRDLAAGFGATAAFAAHEEALAYIKESTRGVLADKVIITVGVVDSEVVRDGFDMTRKGGTVVLTGIGHESADTIQLPGTWLTLYEKTLKGCLFGSCNPHYDIPRLAALYSSGHLRLDGLVTKTYPLMDINEASDDLQKGSVMRAVISYE